MPGHEFPLSGRESFAAAGSMSSPAKIPNPARTRDGRSRDDPLAARSPLLFWLFGWYLRWFFWRRFRAVRVSRAGLPRAPSGRPLIIYSNHPSWWDPALYILLATKLFPGRPGFGPMDHESLGRYGVLERMGVFGIALNTPRGAARFLATSLRVLSDPAGILWITAEGAFTDPRRRPVHLRPGIAHLARRVPGRCHPAARRRVRLLEREPPRGARPLRRPDRDGPRPHRGRLDHPPRSRVDPDHGLARRRERRA